MQNNSKQSQFIGPDFLWNYINLVKDDNILKVLRDQRNLMMNKLLSIPSSKEDFAYDIGKWSIKEMILHVNDTERIFTYRALCIMRGDKTPLPGFDENVYAENSNAAERSLTNIADEFFAIRNSSIHLFESMPEQLMANIGTASNHEVNVRAIAFAVAGHSNHHLNILRDRYGIK